MVFRKVYIVLCAALLAAGDLCAQQVRVEPRIAGLEGNREYMSLLEQDAQLQIREDSIVNAVERARQQLREDPANRQRYSQGDPAARKPDIRSAQCQGAPDRQDQHHRAGVGARQPERGGAAAGGACRGKSRRGDPPTRSRCATWFSTPISASSCPRPIMRPCAGRRGWKLDAVDYVNRYFANYGTICELAEACAAAQTEADAGEIYDRYNTLQGLQPRAGRFARRGMELYRRQQRVCLWLSDGQTGGRMPSWRVRRSGFPGLPANSRHCAARSLRMPWPIISCAKKVLVGYETAVAGLLGAHFRPRLAARRWLRNWMASTSACPVSTWRSAISSTTTVSRSPRRPNTATSTRSPSAGSTSTGRSTVSCWARSIPTVPSPRSGGVSALLSGRRG